MYNVGICDDEEDICSSLEKMILQYAEKNMISIKINVWYSGEGLCDYLQEKHPVDILFLDIKLFRMTGIEVGDFIRNELEDREMQIIYISRESSYAQKLFKTQPLDFLIKPIVQKDINRTLGLAIKILKKKMNRFWFQNGRDFHYVAFDDILYFSSEGRKIKLFLTCGKREFYGKLGEIENRLPDSFLLIHHSYIVNLKHIVLYNYESVELTNGIVLPISRANRKVVREHMFRERKIMDGI